MGEAGDSPSEKKSLFWQKIDRLSRISPNPSFALTANFVVVSKFETN
jgi:hypothetical protein